MCIVFQIPVSDVEFGSCDVAKLQNHLYPPRFTIEVNGAGANGTALLQGTITGFTEPILIEEALNGECHYTALWWSYASCTDAITAIALSQMPYIH